MVPLRTFDIHSGEGNLCKESPPYLNLSESTNFFSPRNHQKTIGLETSS